MSPAAKARDLRKEPTDYKIRNKLPSREPERHSKICKIKENLLLTHSRALSAMRYYSNPLPAKNRTWLFSASVLVGTAAQVLDGLTCSMHAVKSKGISRFRRSWGGRLWSAGSRVDTAVGRTELGMPLSVLCNTRRCSSAHRLRGTCHPATLSICLTYVKLAVHSPIWFRAWCTSLFCVMQATEICGW